MTAKKISIYIETTDKALLNDLKNSKISDITISQMVFTCDSIDWQPIVEVVQHYVVESLNTVALSLFSSWLYDRFKRNNPDKASINKVKISDKPEKIIIIINDIITTTQNKSEIK